MSGKDWIGNAKSAFVCNGASNHSESERQVDDYYATEPKAIDILLCDGGGWYSTHLCLNVLVEKDI